MENTNSSSVTPATSGTPATTGGENETLFIGLALVFAVIAIFLIINYCKKRHRHPIETYINDSKTILRDITNQSISLADYATEYVTKRTNLESSFLSYVNDGSGQLNTVKSAQKSAMDAYNSADGSVSGNLSSAMSKASDDATKAQGAYDNIVNSISGAGGSFGQALNDIQKQKAIAETANTSVKNTITEINTIYTNITAAERVIIASYNRANVSLAIFDKDITDLTENIKRSSEYTALEMSVSTANTLKDNLTGILSELEQNDQYRGEVQSLIVSLSTAINISNGYLNNAITIFTLATANKDENLNAFISRLLSIYSLMVAYIGTDVSSSSMPLSSPLPSLPSGEHPIKWYVDNIKLVGGTVISNYNTTIGYYNKIINNLNQIQTLTSTVYGGLENVSNTFNNSLDNAGNIMKNYLPGSTMPPRSTYPNYITNTPYPTFPTATPFQ